MSPGRCSFRINQLSTWLLGLQGVGKRLGPGRGCEPAAPARGRPWPRGRTSIPRRRPRTSRNYVPQAPQVPSRSGLSATLVSSWDQPCQARTSAPHVGTQGPRQPSPVVALAPQLDRGSGARLRTELAGTRTADPFPGIFNPRHGVKVTHGPGEEKQVHGREVDLGRACANKRAARKASFRLIPTSQRAKRFGGAVSTLCQRGAGCGECTERVSIAHAWRAQQLLPDSHLEPRPQVHPGLVARQVQGLRRALHRSRARTTRPLSCPLLAQPHGARTSPSGGAAAALSLPAEAHPLSFPPRPEVPGLQGGPAIAPLPADAAAHAPTAPSPLRSGYRLMKCSFSSVICFVFLQSSDK